LRNRFSQYHRKWSLILFDYKKVKCFGNKKTIFFIFIRYLNLILFISITLNHFHWIGDAGPPPALLPYQPGPPAHYLEQIRSDRKMLEEVCPSFSFINILPHGKFSFVARRVWYKCINSWKLDNRKCKRTSTSIFTKK